MGVIATGRKGSSCDPIARIIIFELLPSIRAAKKGGQETAGLAPACEQASLEQPRPPDVHHWKK
jgi:hypothetical protein